MRLDKAYISSFNRAGKYIKYGQLLLFTSLVIVAVLLPIFKIIYGTLSEYTVKEEIIAIVVLFSAMLQVAAIYFNVKGNKHYRHGHEIQRHYLLQRSFPKDNVSKNLSIVMLDISSSEYLKMNQEGVADLNSTRFIAANHLTGIPFLRNAVKENSFNNYAYYSYSEKRIRKIFVLGVLLIIIFISVLMIFSIMGYATDDLSIFLLILLITVISLGPVREMYQKMIQWRKGKEKMLSIYSKLNGEKASGDEEYVQSIALYLEYCNTTAASPHIPSSIYKRYSPIVNQCYFSIRKNDFERALEVIIEIINNLDINNEVDDNDWGFVGSFNQFLRGMPKVPGDIDIIASDEIALRINEAFERVSNVKVQLPYMLRETDNLKSKYGRYVIENVPVELFADLYKKGANGKLDTIPEFREDIEKIQYRERGIFGIKSLKLQYEKSIYEHFDEHENAKEIEKYLAVQSKINKSKNNQPKHER